MQNLYPGAKNYYVYLVKLALRRAMLFSGEMSDEFDEYMKNSVINFQNLSGLKADGNIDSATWQLFLPYLYGFNTYRVEKGDTLFSIARKLNSTPELIKTANPEAEPLNLLIGSTLIVPYRFNLVPTDVPYSHILVQYIIYGLKARYPFVEVGSAGSSVMGRPIYYLKTGNGEKEVFYNASHHANEWITTPLLLAFLENYCYAYVNNKTIYNISADTLFETASLYAVPLVNPDGVDLVTGALMPDNDYYKEAQSISESYPQIPFPNGWKANISGTDLNLNYPAYWENAKEIKYARGFTSPAPRDFVGESPLSAVESNSIYNFTKKHNFRLTLSYHTQGEVIYWKFLDFNPEGSYEIALKFGNSSGYTVEETPMASGYAGYKDWFILEYNLPGYTIEAGSGINPLPLNQFNKIYRDNIGILTQGII